MDLLPIFKNLLFHYHTTHLFFQNLSGLKIMASIPRVQDQGCKVVAAARQFTILTLFYAFLYYKIRNFLIYEDILANKVSKCSQEHFLPGYQLILSMEKSLNPTYHV